jgi:hypothetical protein
VDEIGSEARLPEIASRFSELGYVEAVVLAGSVAGGTSDSQSEIQKMLSDVQKMILKYLA